MKNIERTLKLAVSRDSAYKYFVKEIKAWWPRPYTWSDENLEAMRIDDQENGLCSEIGPYNFRCDWARVITAEPGKELSLRWQISPDRIPQPNPAQASELKLHFEDLENGYSQLHLIHRNFEKHGEGAKEYLQAMDAPEGWDYILNCFQNYCEDH